ncbi:MAG: 30S ribosomal protein S6 [Phycisphaeraceae bacterium]
MAENTLYEGLFLLNQQVIANDLGAALDKVREILDHSSAEIVSLRKWDERRLAYTIKGQKRGLYILTLFRAPGSAIERIERDCTLSEEVLRVLITRAEYYGDAEIEAELSAAQTTQTEVQLREGEGEGEGEVEGEGEGEGEQQTETAGQEG